MEHTTNMKSSRLNLAFVKPWYAMAVLLSCLLGLGAASNTAPRTFPNPQAAADALIDAAEKYDVPTLEAIFGDAGKAIIHTEEPAYDQEIAKQFAAQARTKMEVTFDPKSKRRAFITVGNDAWPFPVPIVKVGNAWAFDSKAGLSEILLRRIGRNELDAIEIARGYVEAQHEYALTKHGNPPLNQYAQKIISTPGTQDGLAWQTLTVHGAARSVKMWRAPLSVVTSPAKSSPTTATTSGC